MTQTTSTSNECCPQFNPEPWDEKKQVWKDKLFMMDKVRQFMHIPLNMGAVVTRMFQKIEDAKASPRNEDFLMLAYDPSPWVSEIYMTVIKDVPGGEMVKLSGTYLTKVYDGPYNAVPQWIKKMDEYVSSKDQQVKKYYFYFTTCPKCAKKYGHNYVVVFAQV